MKHKTLKIAIAIVLIVIVAIIIGIFRNDIAGAELRSIGSEKELEQRYEYKYNRAMDTFKYIIGMPFSMSNLVYYRPYYTYSNGMKGGVSWDSAYTPSTSSTSVAESALSKGTTSSKDYSTTNIQVENVDEADIIKTDGDYIYSISDSDVIITDARDAENLKIATKITSGSGIPEDLIIYENKLVVILAEGTDNFSYYSSNNNTKVNIYDISNKERPNLIKSYTMYEPYYTSRCIEGKLYVISSGNLRKENDKIVTYYKEESTQKEIGLDNIKYFTQIDTTRQTLISFIDLNKAYEDVKINSYLIDISNAYVSENGIYLLNQKYEGGTSAPPISSLFGLKGAIRTICLGRR